MLLLNNFESGSNGATISTANSGGTDATAFDDIAIGTNMTATYDSTLAAHGLLGGKFALTSTATAATRVGWTQALTGGNYVTWYGGVYFRTNVASIVSSVRWIDFLTGTTLVARLGLVNANQGVQWRTAADAATGTISGTLSANTLYRCEWQVTANGAGLARVFSGDTTTQVGVDATTAANYTGTTFNAFRIGMQTANFSSTAGDYIAHDSINLNDTGMPGPGPYSAGPVISPPFIPHRMPMGV